MNLAIRTILAAVAIAALTAGKGDVAEYDGSEISSEEGVVILRAIWDRESKGAMSKTLNRDSDKIYGVFKEAQGGKRKVIVEGIDKVRAFVMPTGRWYLAEIRTPNNRDLPQIAKPLQSFQVLGDQINFAGIYNLSLAIDPDSKQSWNTEVDFVNDGPALIKEAANAWPELFTKKQLVYCPIGRLCKPPSELKF